ncbi:hypothetical protein AB1L30_13800 [Bremerella sp. JC817]|uniref:hypothetical protein n=1 Tax=Bremerella sp. JC817 TaxID=3231756 RepID=UPI00345A126C
MAKTSTASVLKPKPGQIVVRMYRQGLGDCFLIAIGKKRNSKPFYMLIDCGVHRRQDNGNDRLREVMNDLHRSTAGELDIVAATHEHVDHLSGFVLSGTPFLNAKQADRFAIQQLWLGWTEKIGNQQADTLRQKHGTAQRIIEKALEHYDYLHDRGLKDTLNNGKLHLKAAMEFSTFDEIDRDSNFENVIKELSKAKPDVTRELERDRVIRQGTTGFSGELAAADRTKPSTCEQAINLLRLLASDTSYCEPGQVIPISDEPEVRAYILGPPRDEYLLKKDLPSKVRGEKDEHGHASYHETYLTPASNLNGFGFSPALHNDETELPQSVRLPFGEKGYDIRAIKDSYYPSRPADSEPSVCPDAPLPERDQTFLENAYLKEPWRRIDGDWLGAASNVALNLDSDTNNTSLAFALEIGPPGKGDVLFFVGDAQVGNWMSWYGLEFDVEGTTVTTQDLFTRTRLYKVGHHGSHNATAKRYYHKDETRDNDAPYGLELMDDIIAMIPVSYYAVVKEWPVEWKMPHRPLYERLREKSRLRILRSDCQITPLSNNELDDCRPDSSKASRIPDTSPHRVFEGWTWKRSKSDFNPMQTGETSDPLYYDVIIPPR